MYYKVWFDGRPEAVALIAADSMSAALDAAARLQGFADYAALTRATDGATGLNVAFDVEISASEMARDLVARMPEAERRQVRLDGPASWQRRPNDMALLRAGVPLGSLEYFESCLRHAIAQQLERRPGGAS